MSAPLLALTGIDLTFGGHPLLEGAELSVLEGERLCLVGRNGSGKSTLLKIAAGTVEADRGERILQQGTHVAYLPQEPDLAGFATTLDYAAMGLESAHRARSLLVALGLEGSEDPARLSGGEARRAALARVLAADPDVLLLDEPTNHLDLPAIEWLESELSSLRAAIVLVSHDRRFLENLSRSTVWLDRGRTRRLDRGFRHFEAWRDETILKEEDERHKLGRKIAREIEWMHYGGVTARRRRNEGRKRKLEAMRETIRTERRAQGQVKMAAAEGDTSGRLVIEARDLAKSYGGRAIVAGLSTRIARGDRVGIVGPNGAGKTTLLKMLTGALPPDAGTVRQGANLQMVTLDQTRDALKDGETVAEALTRGRGDHVQVGGEKKHVLSYMQDFLFAPEQARTPVSRLSGGERARVLLARVLAEPSNLLVLDEPTNDLDLETLDLLEELIAGYEGTAIVVSHDRDFLDRVATSVIASEGNGRWIEYAGGYSDMVAQRGRGVEARTNETKQKVRAARPPAAEPAQKRKLSFKEKHALEALPGRIEKINAEIAALDTRLADAGLYTRDRKAFEEATGRSAKLREELGEAENEWLRLEMLREEIEGGAT
jgi:ATP-binding cassette subfamily F protein uup